MNLVVLDTTEHADLVVVVLNGVMVYADDQNDPHAQNETYDAMFVARALASVLGLGLEHVRVPGGSYHEADDVLAWYNATHKPAPPLRPVQSPRPSTRVGDVPGRKRRGQP